MSLMQEYVAAFNRCYPHKMVELKPTKIRGEVRFRVVIDQDAGDLTLSENDLRDAVRMFNRGHIK